MDKQRWPMGDEWRVSECDQPWVTTMDKLTHGWWVESIRMWSDTGLSTMDKQDDPWVMSGEYQNVISPGLSTWTNRDDPWVMSGEYQNVISPGISTMDKQRWPMGDEWRVSECDQPWVTNDGQTEMTHGWWVESIRMWSALGYNDGQTEMTHGWWVESIRMWSWDQRWTNRDDPCDEWRVSECDQPWVITMDKQRWPMGDEWRVSECDQPWEYQRWINRDDPWVMSGEYQNVISPGLNDGQTEMTHGWWVESIRMWSALGVSTMDKQRWPMGDEWRVSECDQPWVTTWTN